jgi:mono/diheme cytochrome c family protein
VIARALVAALALVLPLAAAAAPASASGSTAFKPGEYPHSNTAEARIYRGDIVFRNYCVLCHGVKADGAGRAAKLYNPKPANLVLSDKNDQYKELIIRQGGAALGRSEFMPPWGNELTDEQVTDVVAYLRSVNQARPAR